MLTPGEEPFLLEYKIEVKSSALKLEPSKSLKVTGAERRPFRGGNGTSQKETDKDCILKLLSDDLSNLSSTSHFESRIDLRASYRLFKNASLACLIFHRLFLLV